MRRHAGGGAECATWRGACSSLLGSMSSCSIRSRRLPTRSQRKCRIRWYPVLPEGVLDDLIVEIAAREGREEEDYRLIMSWVAERLQLWKEESIRTVINLDTVDATCLSSTSPYGYFLTRARCLVFLPLCFCVPGKARFSAGDSLGLLGRKIHDGQCGRCEWFCQCIIAIGCGAFVITPFWSLDDEKRRDSLQPITLSPWFVVLSSTPLSATHFVTYFDSHKWLLPLYKRILRLRPVVLRSLCLPIL